MKQLIIIFIFSLGSVSAYAQSDLYEQKMNEALDIFQKVKSIADYQAAAAYFERIANVETQKWQPLYYHALSYTMMSFIEEKSKSAERDAYLEVAEVDINKMIKIAPTESEVYALQALYYTGKLIINPMERGQKYGALTQGAIQQSLALDPDNPRAKQLDLSNKVGTAQFFGKDIAPYCEEAKNLLLVWDDYEQKGPFYPVWGKDQVEAITKNCDDSKTTETPDETTNATANNNFGYILTVTIQKLSSDNGYIMLELLDENEKRVLETMGTVKNKTATLELKNISPGNYAIRFFHDENENKKMDTGKYGKPTEKYGFSNNARGFMGPPKYKKMVFEVKGDQTIVLNAK